MQKLKNKSISKLLAIGVATAFAGIFLSYRSANECSGRPYWLTDEGKFISIESLINKNLVKADFKGVGGHTGYCIKLELQSKSPDSLFLAIEPGRRLVATDSVYQDILIVKEKKLRLAPFAKISVSLYGFCCQSHDRSPAAALAFKVGFMAPPGWIKLAKVINENNFPEDAVQHAIWVVSNDHPFSSIHAEDLNKIRLLRATVAAIKGQGITISWYSIVFEKDTSVLFSGRPAKLSGQIEYSLVKKALVSITVRDKSGKLIMTLVGGTPQPPGKYSYDVNLMVRNWPRGEYAVFVHEDYSRLNLKKDFAL